MEIFEGEIKNENYFLQLKKERISHGIIVRGKVKGKPGKVKLFEIDLEGKLLINNWQSWGPTKIIDANDVLNIPKELLKKNAFSLNPNPQLLLEAIVSDYFVGNENMLVGFLSSKIGHPYFVIKRGKIKGYIDYFNTEFDDYVEIEPMVILFGNIDVLLHVYAEYVKQEMKPNFLNWNPIGWSSWYYYFQNLTWEDVLRNLNFSIKYPFEVFQIDDSWQKDIGDWEPKENFPCFKEMAETIKKFGYKPGIWLAPFSVSETSKIFKVHKDWLVRNEDGEPLVAYENWNKRIYALDLTHPEVKKYLEELFIKLKDAGFDYFKIDFLFAGAIPGKRYSNISPIQAYREGLKIIRKVVDKSFVLGCGAPLLPSIGYVDGMRIGPDTAPFYNKNAPDVMIPNAYYALRNVIMRYFTNGVWWWNDPDCLLLRNSETELTNQQKKMYALTAGILNNMIFVSDDLGKDLENYLFFASLKLRNGKPFIKGIMSKGFEIKSFGTKIGNVKLRICLETEKSEFYPDDEFLKSRRKS
ncbi:glycoside hydrolase family 36 protein [Thermosipho atlanticus]|uniref:Alpha-galactosidase n=1 Tax=Thermosipho atlanticus DSM 15807 TaxID=1123380 RepID=A0A1M5TL66_9BACT|nr:alpha-galactosidase [Thermosipho atlanticus]SHH51555.1 alpha-galactosidase [Thermosipho atlanticus DSM 15807]